MSPVLEVPGTFNLLDLVNPPGLTANLWTQPWFLGNC